MPTISVIVPVYKVEQHLRRCVDSILSQTFTDFELILVDDGSPDGCPVMCDQYAEEDSRVKVIHQTNQGQSAARNRGVEQAQSQWICFVDSDDAVHPQMLEWLHSGVKNTGARMSLCSALEAGEIPKTFFESAAAEFTTTSCDESLMKRLYTDDPHRYWVIWGKLIDKRIVMKYPLAEGRIYEDSAVVCKWLHEAGTLADCEQALYFYWVNQEGTTKSTFSPKHFDLLWSMEEQIAFFRSVRYQEMLQTVCDDYIWKAVDHYRKAKEDLKRRDIARHVRRKATQIYWQNRKVLGLTPKAVRYCAEVFYPRVMKWYWAFHNRVRPS